MINLFTSVVLVIKIKKFVPGSYLSFIIKLFYLKSLPTYSKVVLVNPSFKRHVFLVIVPLIIIKCNILMRDNPLHLVARTSAFKSW